MPDLKKILSRIASPRGEGMRDQPKERLRRATVQASTDLDQY